MRNLLILAALALPATAVAANPQVTIETNHGTIVAELFAKDAPESTKNFLSYVDDKFYDGTIFHRVIDGFMIQGGGFDASFKKKATKPPIKNEATNGLKNKRGTLAMARTSNPHSATAQFFFNVVDNKFLDHPGQTGWGYAVFGKVLKGMDILDKIKKLKTGPKGSFGRDAPQQDVIIKSVTRVVAKKK